MATPFGPDLEFPPDDFSSVTPDELAAAQAELDNPGEMEFPPDNFADVTPADFAAYQAELDAEAGTPAGYPGGDPFAVLRAPSASRPYLGFPTNPDLAPPVEPEPLPTADAITGVGPIPASPMASGIGIPEDMFQAAMAGVPMETQGTPEFPAEYLSNQENGIAYAMSSPQQQIEQQLDLEQRRNDVQRKAQAELRTADTLRAERDEQNLYKSRESSRKKLEQVAVEAKAEAAREIDINRGWANASTGTKIAGIFSAIAGGLVAHKYGGRNSGLEMIDNLINRDIDAQKFNKSQRVASLTAQGGAARDLMALAEDDYVSDTRMRLSAYDRVAAQIQADAQNFDPRGTQAIRYGQAYQEILGKQQQIVIDAKKRGDAEELTKLSLEEKRLDNDIKRATLAKAQRAAMGGGSGKPIKPQDVKREPAYFTARGLVPPPAAMSENAYEDWQKRKIGSNTIASTSSPSGMSNEEKERRIPGLSQPDGSSFIALGTPEQIGKVRAMKSGTEQAVRRIDDAIRTRTGWTSNTGNSVERQKLRAQWGHAKLAAKNTFDLGAITASDIPLIEGALGTNDPSGWKDPVAAMMEARRLLIDRMDTELRGLGYEGERWNIRAPKIEAPTEAAGDLEFKAALEAPTLTDVISLSGDVNWPIKPADLMGQYVADGREPTIDNVVLPSVRRTIDRLTEVAKSAAPREREQAHVQLERLAAKGGSEGVRSAAEAALMTLGRPPEQDEGPRQATVKDEISQPVRR